MSDPARELAWARGTVALADLASWGRLIGTGPDLLDLLHRLSTADLRELAPGEGRAAVLTSPKGRIVERVSVHNLAADGVLLLAGPGGSARVLSHLARYTFAEITGLRDLSPETFALALIGPRWEAAGRACGFPDTPPYGGSSRIVGGASTHLLRTNGFDAEGWVVIGPAAAAGVVRDALARALASAGGGAAGPEAFEAWRVLSGHPAAGRELTEEHNPLEAGLLDAVSFTKGCYVGQEVVARLRTYDKVARRIVRLAVARGAPAPAEGAKVLFDGREIGDVTSAILPPGQDRAAVLAYVKVRELPKDARDVEVEAPGGGRVAAEVVTR